MYCHHEGEASYSGDRHSRAYREQRDLLPYNDEDESGHWCANGHLDDGTASLLESRTADLYANGCIGVSHWSEENGMAKRREACRTAMHQTSSKEFDQHDTV